MRRGFIATDPEVRPQSLDVWGGFGLLDSRHVFCLRCVGCAFGGTRGLAKGRELGAPDVAGEPHIHRRGKRAMFPPAGSCCEAFRRLA